MLGQGDTPAAWTASAVAAAVLLTTGCGDDCADVACDACGPALVLVVTTAEGVPPTIDGESCVTDDPFLPAAWDDDPATQACAVYGLEGAFSVRVAAAGFTPRDVEGVVSPTGEGCCACANADPPERRVTLAPI